MPTYTYQCKTCKKSFEAFHSMSAEPLKDCPEEECLGTVEKLIGAGAGAILKGTGFYQTDFKNSKQKSPACNSCPSSGSCEG